MYNLAVNNDIFMESIYNRMADATTKYQKYPILHISAHGNENGLVLTDGTPINWSTLKSVLLPINRLLRGQFVISLSSCRGFSACKMAMGINGEIPFGAIIGPLYDIPWEESAIAFMVFYNRLSKDKKAYEAVMAMNYASGGNNFETTTGINAQARFRRELEKIQFQHFQQQLMNLKQNK